MECVIVVLPGGDKGMDEHFSGRTTERWLEFGDTTQMKQGSFTNTVHVIKVKIGVKPDS